MYVGIFDPNVETMNSFHRKASSKEQDKFILHRDMSYNTKLHSLIPKTSLIIIILGPKMG